MPPKEVAPQAEPVNGEAEADVVEAFDPRVSIPESLGMVRRRILEELIDSESPMSVAQFIASMPGITRGAIESGLLRNLRTGLVEKTAPGTYRLAPPPKRPEPPPPTPVNDQLWFDALDRWAVDRSSWTRSSTHHLARLTDGFLGRSRRAGLIGSASARSVVRRRRRSLRSVRRPTASFATS